MVLYINTCKKGTVKFKKYLNGGVTQGENMLDKAVGIRIRELREKRDMTREEVAVKAKITPKFLYEVENGKKGMSAGNLYRIAVALSTSCDYILLGVHRMDDEAKLESIYAEALKGFNEEQRKSVIKILRILLEISE